MELKAGPIEIVFGVFVLMLIGTTIYRKVTGHDESRGLRYLIGIITAACILFLILALAGVIKIG